MATCIIECVCVELLELIFPPTIVVCSLLLLIATCKLYVIIIIVSTAFGFSCMFGATRYQNNCSCLHDTTVDDIIRMYISCIQNLMVIIIIIMFYQC